jgi:hypothetical protein
MTGNSSFIALGDHLPHKIRPWFALTISHAWKSFWSHTMLLLGIMSHVGTHFNPFRHSVSFGTRSDRVPTTFAPKVILPPLQVQSYLKYYGNRGQLHLFYLIALAKIQTQDFSPLALILYWVLSCMHQLVQTKSLSC